MNKITFPFKGINNNNSYETQPLGTCNTAVDVRGYDALKGRLRGGQRPGLSKYIAAQINGAADIHDINHIQASLPKTDGLDKYILCCTKRYVHKFLLADGTKTTFYDIGSDKIIYEMVRDSAGNIYICHQNDGGVYTRKLNSAGVIQWSSTTELRGLAFDDNANRLVGRSGNYFKGLDPSDGSEVFTSVDIGAGGGLALARTRIGPDGYYYTNGIPVDVDSYYRQLWKINPASGAIEWQFCVHDTATLYCTGFDIDNDGNILVSSNRISASDRYGINPTTGLPTANIWMLNEDGAIQWYATILNGTSAYVDSVTWASDGNFYLGFVGDDAPARISVVKKIKLSDYSVMWDYTTATGAPAGIYNIYDIREDAEGEYVYIGIDRTDTWENNDGIMKSVIKLPVDGTGTLPIWAGDASYNGRYLSTTSSGWSQEAVRVNVTSMVVAGDIYKYRGGVVSAVTDGTGVMRTDDLLMSQPAFNDIFFVDGKSTRYFDINYTAASDSIKVWTATNGTLPALARLMALYRGRIVLSGQINDPHNWYMSKVGDPFDWEYFPAITTAIQAVAGNNSEVGLIGDIINGIAPWSDDVCIFGCDSSIWAMAGDPAAGGSIDLVTDKTGMSFGKAWCFDPNGVLYFHGVGGIFRLVPGGKPESLTDHCIKRTMESIDLSANYVRLHWDINQQGLHAVIMAKDYNGICGIYFWDSRQAAWWKDSYLTGAEQPMSFYALDADDPDDRYFLMGCKDGYMRKIDNTAGTDDGIGISSEITLGPYIASPGKTLQLNKADITLGRTSGNLDFYIYSGDYAEAAITMLNTRVKRTLKAGLNRRLTHKVKAPALKFILKSPPAITTRWALENLSINVKESGTTRKGRV